MADTRKFTPLGDPCRHYWMVQRMARATDADLVAAQEAGALPQEDWAHMVERCRRCRWVEGCQRWLDGGNTAQIPPVGCLNRSKIYQLKQEVS